MTCNNNKKINWLNSNEASRQRETLHKLIEPSSSKCDRPLAICARSHKKNLDFLSLSLPFLVILRTFFASTFFALKLFTFVKRAMSNSKHNQMKIHFKIKQILFLHRCEIEILQFTMHVKLNVASSSRPII